MNRLIYRLNTLNGGNRNVLRTRLPIASEFFFSTEGTKQPAKTLVFQDKLGRLPVPEIKDTVSKFLQMAEPHLSNDEYRTTAKKLMQLTEPMGIGEKLQQILLERKQEKDNWFADWWLEMAYLAYREPLPVWSSPGLAFPHRNFRTVDQQIDFAAKVIVGTLDFKTMLEEQTLPVEFAGKHPVDMKTYYNLFGTNRVPQENVDRLMFHPDSKHIVVVHNKNFFKMVVGDDSGKWVNFQQARDALSEIVSESNNLGPGSTVGGLTSDNRDNWAKAYQILRRDNRNCETIDEIESSLFVMCLDGDVSHAKTPSDSMARTALQSLHGFQTNFENRWYDKTLQYFVGSSGENGLVSEHSPADGVVVMKICDHALDYADGNLKLDESGLDHVANPRELRFHLEGDEIFGYLQKAKQHMDGLIGDLQMRVLNFDVFGKKVIKTFKVSPDSFVQMGIQYAFYKMHKCPGATYESGGTRMFHRGRTEAIRSCSMASLEFAKAMLDESSSDKEKYNALIKAIQGHNKYAKMATQGMGVDRHFQGLKKAAQEHGIQVPEIFDDPGYLRSSRMRLSTSQISSVKGSFTCFGPLQKDGYGICYSINNNGLVLSVSSMNSSNETCSENFKDNLAQAFLEMQQICATNSTSTL